MDGKGSSRNMDLLPPSAFESKRSSDPWKELAKTTGELIHLRLENQQLRQEKKAPQQAVICPNEAIRARVDLYKSRDDKTTSRHLDELIQRQAAEIAQLKEEVRTLQADHKQEVVELEKEIAVKERQHLQAMASVETELKTRADNYEYQVDRLSSAHQEEVEELTDRLDKLTSELETTRTSFGQKVSELQAQLQSVTETSCSRIEELEKSQRTKDELIVKLENQLSSLKRYIGECERGPLPEEVWKKERAMLEKKQKELSTEKESLLSTVQLLNIRLSAANDILTLQEKELSKSKVESVDKSKLETFLLTRWREKVFALMVQQRSADIVSKKDFQNWKEKIKKLEVDLASEKTRAEVLTCSLSDRDAQLEMERKQNQLLQEDLTNAQQIAIALDDQLSDCNQQIEGLKQALINFGQFFSETATTTQHSMNVLKTYGQRVTFATGRLEMLQAQFARKEALLRSQIEQGRKTPAERDTSPPPTEDRLSATSHLQEELDAVTRERDTLAAQIREDALMLETRLASCRQEVQSDIANLRSSVVALEMSLQERSEKCVFLSERVETLEGELEESRDSLEELRTELGKQQLSAQQALKTREDELVAEFTDRMAGLERSVNDAKREHAKAVVTLRQVQRQASRDRERLEETAQLREEHYGRQVEALQQQLRAVEKERNVMMTTLRQEGLLSGVKQQRENPVILEDSAEQTTETKQEEALPGDQPKETGAGALDEPLSAVLEDLQSLTAAVMEEENNDSDIDSSDDTNK
ncbi:coiled-coil alpha-helical rod protein 1-like [Liolophura sinensis]|uniref:coiled-coil alpha-helical rod protein 1-like n=1 Tax=Liolophura sinensis TaxID=3198878 RepID=UPI003158083D